MNEKYKKYCHDTINKTNASSKSLIIALAFFCVEICIYLLFKLVFSLNIWFNLDSIIIILIFFVLPIICSLSFLIISIKYYKHRIKENTALKKGLEASGKCDEIQNIIFIEGHYSITYSFINEDGKTITNTSSMVYNKRSANYFKHKEHIKIVAYKDCSAIVEDVGDEVLEEYEKTNKIDLSEIFTTSKNDLLTEQTAQTTSTDEPLNTDDK